MTKYPYVHKIEISNGKKGKILSKTGDKVKLIQPPSLRQDNSDENYCARESYRFNKKILGKGPYVILEIGYQTSQNTIVYVKGKKSSYSVYANGLMKA
jgi:hypothetical protein